jgi:hypothetical protein
MRRDQQPFNSRRSGSGLPIPIKGIALNVADQLDDSQRLRPIMFDPPRQILKCRRIKLQVSQELRPQGFRSRGPWHRVTAASSRWIEANTQFLAPTRSRATNRLARLPRQVDLLRRRHSECPALPSISVYPLFSCVGFFRLSRQRVFHPRRSRIDQPRQLRLDLLDTLLHLPCNLAVTEVSFHPAAHTRNVFHFGEIHLEQET